MRGLWLILCLLLAPMLAAKPRQIDAYRWDGVDRIVAIGDLHGDYDSYLGVLKAAGIVNARGRWSAGGTHLVQTGDIPDRGPDTRRIIAHLAKLAREAEKRGGRVHHLIGNHEAMNVQGDLRYVIAGEFEAFVDKQSATRRDRYFNATLQTLQRSDPARFAALPADFREQFNRAHPLGWVEHRLAWDPRFGDDGELLRWTLQAPVAVQLNDAIFLHGGISASYCGNSLASLTEKAHAALRDTSLPGRTQDPEQRSILNDPQGPLWYRGLAGVSPAARPETVQAILAQHDARHLVIGHTGTGGVIWPRLNARVILIDTGMSAAYGRHLAWLEFTKEGAFAGYPGGRVTLPMRDAERARYLDAVIALQSGNPNLQRRRELLQAGAGDGADLDEAGNGTPALEPEGTTCGTSP